MYSTTYHRPATVDEAVALFAKGNDAKYLAGGHTLIPIMKQRLAGPSDVIDIARIPSLIGIEANADTLTIKAATTYFDILQSADVNRAIPAIAHLTSVLGDPAVRHRGTIGGSIATNDPTADYPAAVLALNATVKTNKREIPADQFFKGLFSTALEENEIITAIAFPIPQKAGYAKMRNPASRFALTGGVRRQAQIRRDPRHRHRRLAERRDARAGDRTGAEQQLVRRGAGQHHRLRGRPDGRHPRHLGLSRQSDQGDGATRGGRRGVRALRRAPSLAQTRPPLPVMAGLDPAIHGHTHGLA